MAEKKLTLVPKPQGDPSLLEQMSRCALLSDFSEEILVDLLPYTRECDLPAGTPILTEGMANDQLFFLMSGELGVYSGGELVIRVKSVGEIIGEVSVMSQKPCNASVITEVESKLLEINVAKLFSENNSFGAQRFQNELFQSYSEILSSKLEATNQRAKKFEQTNEQLQEAQKALMQANAELEKKVEKRTADLKKQTIQLEQQNTELTASHEKLTELYQAKNLTIGKLNTLYSDHLLPLRETLHKISDTHQGDATLVQAAEGEVAGLVDLLKPLASMHSSELAMRDKRVLLAESDKKNQRVAQLALGGTGVSLDIVSDIEAGKKCIDENEYEVLCVNSELLELTQYAEKKKPKMRRVFLASEDIRSYLARLKQFPGIENIVLRNPENRNFTVKNILTTVRKLIDGQMFGLEKYLLWGADVIAQRVAGSAERRNLIEQMGEHFAQLGVRSRVIDDVKTVAEELLMNAIYDAPVDKQGNSLYNHLPRTEKVDLKPEEQAAFRYACDGVFVGISVEDPFGAFNKKTVLDYLEHCYSGTDQKLKEDTGGGGQGLHILIETADLVIFNVHPGVRTEAIALFHVDHKEKKEHTAPSFQFFCREK